MVAARIDRSASCAEGFGHRGGGLGWKGGVDQAAGGARGCWSASWAVRTAGRRREWVARWTSKLADHVAVDVTDSIDSPSENSGAQIVPYVATEATSLLVVPNINSSGVQQLVPDVATNVPSSIDVSNYSALQDGNNNGGWKQAVVFGFADCATTIIAVMNKPPSSSEPVYFAAEVIIFTAGILEMFAALWVSFDPGNRRTAERRILYASIITCVLGLIVDAYALK